MSNGRRRTQNLLLTACMLCIGCERGLGSQVCGSANTSEEGSLEPDTIRRFELAITSSNVSPEKELRSQDLSIGVETDAGVEQLSMRLFDDQGTLIDEATTTGSADGAVIAFEREIRSLEGLFSFIIEIEATGIQEPEPVEVAAFLEYCEETRNGSEDREVELLFCPDAC